ncbi:MAG: hypothetical protein M3068_02305 [Gemmatimonadota bacterium]|nr:hypothetical protein [Gemmatimonadota bacterium]
MRRGLARLARAAPAGVFVVEGLAPPEPLALLRLSPAIHVVDSPRSATILLVAGDVPPSLREVVRRIHDEMAVPRCTVTWQRDGTQGSVVDENQGERHTVIGSPPEVASRLVELQAELVAGRIPSEAPLVPDLEPAEWRGVGPYGQGGTGMTGGVPYGRPMAETAPDRDGLRLDRLEVRVGPFFPAFPPGLVLTLGLQGDVIQDVSVGSNPFADTAVARDDDPFRRALAEPVRIATLELARARHHLHRLAHTLHVHGLDALGLRALGLSEALTPGAVAPIAALGRLLERTRALAVATDGVGILSADAVHGRGLGPVARASGVTEDARTEEASYQALDFEPLTQPDGDARARLRLRLAEAEQSVMLAGRALDAVIRPSGRIESPRGVLTQTTTSLQRVLGLLPQLLPGMEWGDAVTTVVSLDVDLRDLPEESSPAARGAA